MFDLRDMKIIIITFFCVAPWVCFGLRCKFNEKIPGYWTKIVNCQTDEHYCAAANCTAFWGPGVITHFTSWGCFNSTDSQKCSELFTARSYVDVKYTCDPCVIGEKDVDLANENFTRVLRCKRGEETGRWNHTEIVECNDGSHFCVAASCIYLNSGFGPPPKVKKAVYNVTKWDCSSHYGMFPYIPDRDMLCDKPRFIGEKNADLANINYTGVFPTAHEYKLAGLEPPTKTTRPMANAGKLESAFINLLLVMLTFVVAILCRF